ncbi:BLOC-2 complex member HPS6 [Gastrophryne carolinensis]
MTQFGPPELLTDYGIFGRAQALREALQPGGDPRVFLSPDGRHMLVCVTRHRRLLSFPRLPAAPGEYLDYSWAAQAPPLCGLLFLQSSGHGWLVAVVGEGGLAEVWSPPSVSPARPWTLLQSVELCGGPRARLVSVCAAGGDGSELLWCEERPPSKLPAAPSLYCVCRRSLRIAGKRVTMGTVRIVLHHSPPYTMAAAASHVFMIPNAGYHPILVYTPAEETVALTTVTAGAIHRKALTDADYKKLSLEYVGFTAHQALSKIHYTTVTSSGCLLLLTTTGQIYLLYRAGTVQHVYNLDPELCSVPIKMEVFGETLACVVDPNIYLININTGRLMAMQPLPAQNTFFLNIYETLDIQLLTEAGVYKIAQAAVTSSEETGTAESALLETVYEEACKYYQRRSLSGTRLTVQALKKEGMFQAPITLATILKDYRISRGKSNKYTELLNNLANELQSFTSLELLRSKIVCAADTEVDKYCDELVDLELGRLLQTDLDRDGLVYVNFLFSSFPKSAWMSLNNNFQFQQNGDGKLVVLATTDLWKKVLAPLPLASKESSQNGVYPLFEVICQSLCTYKPKWLPGFVQHAQECSGLLWSFNAKKNSEGGPLYKRALSVLNKHKEAANIDLEVDILIGSGRPQAIIQAIHILIRLQRWSQVMEETQRHSQLHPLIKRDVFTTLLVEFVQHRHLDPYIGELSEICPEDLTATDILGIVLQNMPKTAAEPPPFRRDGEVHLTVGLLKPLLNKVLQNQLASEEKFSSATSPPVAPQRTSKPVSHNAWGNGDDLSPTDIYASKTL